MKKKYEKPALTEVKLKPEEAILLVCKTPASSGFFNPCVGGAGSDCSSDGS